MPAEPGVQVVVGLLLKGRKHMALNVQRHRDAAVAQPLAYHLGMEAPR